MKPLGITFKRIFNIMHQGMNDNLKQFDLTISQLHIIIYLYQNKDEDISQRNIEKNFKLSNPTINGLLNRLETKGFIKKTISKKDARFKTIHLTTKSISMYQEILTSFNMMEQKIVKDISKEDLIIFEKVLNKILENII